MEEVVLAGKKHNKAAIAVKEISEDLKKRITGYREHNLKLQDEIEHLDEELKEQHDIGLKVRTEKNKLE